MARKKKHRKPRPGSGKPSPKTGVALGDELKTCLAEKRGRKAIAVAKEMQKSGQAQAEHVPLFAAAYSLRAWEMLADGHGREAADMIDAVLAGHREWASHLDPQLPVLLDLHRPKPSILPKYGQGDATIDEQIAAALRAKLTDPRLLADLAGLAPEHPLRSEAALLMAAWQAVESNPGEPLPDGLRSIPRRSPLAPWRLFVQALHAYYTLDQENLTANLERIPADSAVRPLAEALLCLDRNEAPALPSGADILEQTRGPSLSGQLERIDQEIRRGNRPRAIALTNEVGDSLRKQGRDALAADIEAYTILELKQGDNYIARFDEGTYTNQERLRRVLPRLVVVLYPNDWRFLEVLLADIKPFQPIERALLWRKIATIRAEDEIRYGEADGQPLPKDFLAGFQRSADIFPLPETFRLWHSAELCLGLPSKALAAWAKHFPDDPELGQERIQHMRRHGDHEAALTTLAELVQRTGSTPHLTELRGYIQLEAATAAFMREEPAKTQAIAAEIEPATPLLAMGKAVADWMVAKGNKARRETGERMAALGLPLLAYHVARQFDPELTFPKLPSAIRRGIQGKELFPSIVYLSRIEDPEWKLYELPSHCWLYENYQFTKEPPDVLLDTMSALAELDHRAHYQDIAFLAWNGLKRPDPCPRAPFLAWRAFAYEASGANFKHHVDKLLGAALWFADFQKTDPGVVDAVAARLSIADIRKMAAQATRKSSFALLKAETVHPHLLWENSALFSTPSMRFAQQDELDDDWDDDWDDDDWGDADIIEDELFDIDGPPTPEKIERMKEHIRNLRETIEGMSPKARKKRLDELRNMIPAPLRDLSDNPLDTMQAMCDMVGALSPEPATPPKPQKPPEDDRQLTFPFF